MTYQTVVLPNGRIDADALPDLPPGAAVEIVLPKSVESLHAMFAKLAKIGESSKEIYRGQYTREMMYEDEE